MNMSPASSSPAASPPAARPQHNCVECKRLKRACDKQYPCGKCIKANRECVYRDQADDGLHGPILSGRDVHSVAFGTLLDIHHNKPKVKEAVSKYFNGVNTWFTVVERTSFEDQLETSWDGLPAELSVLALCMALLASPPNQKQSKGMGDTTYHSIKTVLAFVQSKITMSVDILQAELLVALYEFSHGMPEQAYRSLGNCLQTTKMLGWHNSDFWRIDNQVSLHRLRELKLSSILWWAIVYVDCLLNVGYQDQTYPMNTAAFTQFSRIPRPEDYDYLLASFSFQFGVQHQVLQDPTNPPIEGIVFPEAASAWYLSCALHHLRSPTPTATDPKSLSSEIWKHAMETGTPKWLPGDHNGAVGADFIALMKLIHPALLGSLDPPSMVDPMIARAIRKVVDVIHSKACNLSESEDWLDMGAISPCWAFAMSYASLLLIAHSKDVLQDADWLDKVGNLRRALDIVSRRWKIAERYCEVVKVALDNHRAAYAG